MADAPPFEPAQMKLGRLPARFDTRSLRLSNYLDFAKLAPAPVQCDWFTKVPQWGMFGNDRAGDCVEAAAGHLIESWSADNGSEASITDRDVIGAYSTVTGYTPSNPATDQGTNMLTFLNWWRQVGMAGHKIGAFVAVDIANDLEVLYAIWLFGGIYIGVNMPLSAQAQPTLWDVPAGGAVGQGAPGSWGGHCIPCGSYQSPTLDTLDLVTWGQRIAMTKAFWRTYTEECWALLSPDWASGTRIAPSGFAYNDLLSDLQAITGGPLPTPQPKPAPPTPVQHFVATGPAAPFWKYAEDGGDVQAGLDANGNAWGNWFRSKGAA